MKHKLTVALLAFLTIYTCWAQDKKPIIYRNFPLIPTLQFHSLTLPFHDIKSNFSNVGIGLGTELSLNKRHTIVQQGHAVWFQNRAVGNGLLFYTQSVWRPALLHSFFGELKAGVGYLVASRPAEAYKPVDGEWQSAGHQGKGLVTIPIGISLGYQKPSDQTYFSPFISYQFLLVTGYNKSMPFIPQTLLQIGGRIHFRHH